MVVWEHNADSSKKNGKMFVSFPKNLYLCTRYPENNLFTLGN